jgi:hypothetical protein
VGVGAQVLWDAAALDNLALIRQVDYRSVHDACASLLVLALITVMRVLGYWVSTPSMHPVYMYSTWVYTPSIRVKYTSVDTQYAPGIHV